MFSWCCVCWTNICLSVIMLLFLFLSLIIIYYLSLQRVFISFEFKTFMLKQCCKDCLSGFYLGCRWLVYLWRELERLLMTWNCGQTLTLIKLIKTGTFTSSKIGQQVISCYAIHSACWHGIERSRKEKIVQRKSARDHELNQPIGVLT